jgi:hypothetical protein
MTDQHLESQRSEAELGGTVRQIALELAYPPTPDIAATVRRKLTAHERPPERQWPTKALAGALAVILLLLAIVLAVPQVRAAVLEFLQIGAIRIVAPTATSSAPTAVPAAGPATASPASTSRLLDIAGETSLAEAAARVNFPITLPEYPPDLGPPDQVYLQELGDPGIDGSAVILVWRDPDRPDEARLSLYEIDVPYYGIKQAPLEVLRETRVNGQLAFWVQGPHRLQLQAGGYQEWFFVPGNVLLWTDGTISYRLESGLSFEESVRIAESLR